MILDIGLRIEKTGLQPNDNQNADVVTANTNTVMMTVSFKNINPFSIGVTIIVSNSCNVRCEVLEQSQNSNKQTVSAVGHAIRLC